MKNINVDAVIIGGGIAGLWTLASLRKKGLHAILLEKEALGSGQTLASQGIIHGGSKYALNGVITRAAKMISNMPEVWRNAMLDRSTNAINLSKSKLLSSTQYLAPSARADSKMFTFPGSKSMASHNQAISGNDIPTSYQELGLRGNIFQLDEMVFAVQTILHCFTEQYGDFIFQANISAADINSSEKQHCINTGENCINSPYVIIACGEGFESLQLSQPKMQKRPLQMVMMAGANLPSIYAHFIGRSNNPLLTITSHPHPQSLSDTVWYMGGSLAEDGAHKTAAQQIAQCIKLLTHVLPNIEVGVGDPQVRFATQYINRAEHKQRHLSRPDDAYIHSHNNIISGWPTKLSLAPRFAEKVLAEIPLNRTTCTTQGLPNLPKAELANYPWHQL